MPSSTGALFMVLNAMTVHPLYNQVCFFPYGMEGNGKIFCSFDGGHTFIHDFLAVFKHTCPVEGHLTIPWFFSNADKKAVTKQFFQKKTGITTTFCDKGAVFFYFFLDNRKKPLYNVLIREKPHYIVVHILCITI